MPTKRKTTEADEAAAAALPPMSKELIEQFVPGPMSAEAVQAASMAFKKALIERALGAKLSHDLAYAPGAAKPEDAVEGQVLRGGLWRCFSRAPGYWFCLALWHIGASKKLRFDGAKFI